MTTALPIDPVVNDWVWERAKCTTPQNSLSERVVVSDLGSCCLRQYDGHTDLEAFLVRLDDCVRYFNWPVRAQLFHLRTALVGDAAQVLVQVGPQATLEQIVGRLRSRFGLINHVESLRNTLRNRRQQAGESLQDLYADICQLKAQAYPNDRSAFSQTLERHTFIDAITDTELCKRVLFNEPKDIHEALASAVRYQTLMYPGTFQPVATLVDPGHTDEFSSDDNVASEVASLRATLETLIRE